MAGESGQRAGRGGRGVAAGNGGRVEWVDTAKGVGILLVIAGHVWWRPGPVHQAIYAFHMPLFFLLSGYMVRPQPMGRLFVRQVHGLLVPYACFCLLLLLADRLVEGARGHHGLFPSISAGIWAILVHTDKLRGPFTILWFVPCLFFARLAWNLVARWWPDPADWRWALLVIAVMAGAHALSAHTHASPMGMLAVPAAFTLYWVGQLWRARAPGPLLLALLILLAWGAWFRFPAVNLKIGDYSTPVLALAGAAAISILLCLILRRLPPSVQAPFAWLGRVSLIIMYVHVAFIHYLAPYLPPVVLFLVALVGSLIIHLAAAATRPGRRLLLGEQA